MNIATTYIESALDVRERIEAAIDNAEEM